ncbi:MAG TPA: DUF6499 domain-containing protein [Acidiphilium sp.]|nr:DUF6499 domain-containing protein [Acidiphilium sp.]
MSKEDWRSKAAYQYAEALDPSGLAWEFLRRNPDYQADFETGAPHAERGTSDPARRWGLRFPH